MADVGTTTTVTFATSGFTAEVVGIEHTGLARPSIPTSHMATPLPTPGTDMGGLTFMPGKLADPGELSLEIHHDPDVMPPIGEPAEQITLTFPIPAGKISGATYVGTGFCTTYQVGIPLEDKMTGTLGVKWSGLIAHTPSA